VLRTKKKLLQKGVAANKALACVAEYCRVLWCVALRCIEMLRMGIRTDNVVGVCCSMLQCDVICCVPKTSFCGIVYDPIKLSALKASRS